MRLIIVRHGQTDWNRERRYMGSTDIELNDEGRRQAEKVAQRLKDYDIKMILTSPMKRALETAREIRRYHPDAELVVEKDLREVDFGILEGMTKDEIKKKYKDHWDAIEKNDFNHKVPGGESYAEASVRVLNVLDKVLKSGKDSVIVAHGMVNKIIFMKLMNKLLDEIEQISYRNTSVSVFEMDGGSVRVEEFNCDKHLT